MFNRRQFSFFLGSSALVAQVPAPPGAPPAPEVEWHDAKTLTIEGLGFTELKSPYDRLPARAENVVRQAVWDLSRNSAGVLVRFSANTSFIHARWQLTSKELATPTMTATGASGLDLYAKTGDGLWHWLSIGKPTKFPENTEVLAAGLPPGQRDYMLYLPLLNSVTSLEIGISKGATIAKAAPRSTGSKPLVFWGTSITHGISASRPGMTHVALLGRIFDREVINLGFAGNGKMEPEVTKFVAELDPAVFILDCLPNMVAQEINERAEVCVKTLRAAHPRTPILLVEDRNYQDDFLNAPRRERNETNHAAMRAVWSKLQQDKVPYLYYLKADDLLGSDGDGTIDGSHPTDLGFLRQATEFQKVLNQILK